MRRVKRSASVAVALISAMSATASCHTSTNGALAPSGATTVPRLAPHGLHIEAATWTDGPWPFTVAQGDLACTAEGGMQMQTFTADGVTYALNSAAKGAGRYPPVDAIWRQDPNLSAAKVNIAEVLDYARSLCPG
jgi:hypothetical protein